MVAAKKAGHPGPIVRAYRKGDRENLAALVDRDNLVLVVDPGAHGIASLFSAVKEWEAAPPAPFAVYPFRSFDGLAELRDAYDHVIDEGTQARLTVVIEESFAAGRGNAKTDIVLARYAGAVIGALSAITKGNGFDVVFVLPQAWIGALTSKAGNKVRREERKALAKAHAERHLTASAVASSAGLAPHREAYCDTYGIATWWGNFSRHSRPDLYGTR